MAQVVTFGCTAPTKLTISAPAPPSPLWNGVRSRAPVATRAANAQETLSAPASAHPDAVRRRQEAEERKQERERQRAAERAAKAEGKKWWEGEMPPNMSVAVTVADFQHALQLGNSHGKLIVANFFGEDCYSCRTLHPKLKQIAGDNPDVLFLKVNAGLEDLYNFCVDMGLTKVPYFVLYRKQQKVSQFSASLNPAKLALLRAEIAAQKAVSLQKSDSAVYAECEA